MHLYGRLAPIPALPFQCAANSRWRVTSSDCMGPDEQTDSDYSENQNMLTLPLNCQHVRVLSVENTGSDFGAWAQALEMLGGVDEVCGEGSVYGAVAFINSSCRGPFLPEYVAGIMHWATPFLTRLSGKIKLVGPALHFIPAYSTEVAMCDARRSKLWENIAETGAGPRIDTFMFVTDRVGLGIIHRGGALQAWNSKRAAVNEGEYGVSRSILEAGFSLTSLNTLWADKDLSDVRNWVGPAGFDPVRQRAVTTSEVRSLWRDKPPIVYAPHPLELVFIKTLWGETGALPLQRLPCACGWWVGGWLIGSGFWQEIESQAGWDGTVRETLSCSSSNLLLPKLQRLNGLAVKSSS